MENAFGKLSIQEAENQKEWKRVPCTEGGDAFEVRDGAKLTFTDVDFSAGANFIEIRAAGGYNGVRVTIQVSGKTVGQGMIKSIHDRQTWHSDYFQITPIEGIQTVSLQFEAVPAGRPMPVISFIRFYQEQPDGYTALPPLQTPEVSRELFSDTWVGCDDLGRNMPTDNEVKSPNARTVMAFYFIANHVTDPRAPISDNVKILTDSITNPKWGPEHTPHYWSEPYFGYYISGDEWVIRKHATMLSDIGVDVICLDITNQTSYDVVIFKIFEVFAKMREEGNKTPAITFMLPDNQGAEGSARHLYNIIYEKGYYQNLWFTWKTDKPFLLGNFNFISDEMRNVFELRRCWAWTDGKDTWNWVEHTPQDYGWHEDAAIPEEVSVSAAQHATTNMGRSYKNGCQPDYHSPYGMDINTSYKGIYLAEQWESALQTDPQLIFLTGFNEWTALRFVVPRTPDRHFLGKEVKEGGSLFVDVFTPEYSRDLEPINGAFYDNCYYQTAQNIRRYKGARKQFKPSGKQTISLDAPFDQWDTVLPEYRDSIGDHIHRSEVSFGQQQYYLNQSGYNDIEAAKIARDEDMVYFYVRCAAPITAPEPENWMTLYINIGGIYDTGWYGYDFVVNRILKDDTTSILERSLGGWNWEPVCDVPFRLEGREMMLAIPRSVLGLKEPITIDFKWADHSQKDGNIYDFMTLGDVAPNNRFNYRFTELGQEEQLFLDGYQFDRQAARKLHPSVLTRALTILSTQHPGAFVHNQYVSLKEAALPTSAGLVLPVGYLSPVFGIKTSVEKDLVAITFGHLLPYTKTLQLTNGGVLLNDFLTAAKLQAHTEDALIYIGKELPGRIQNNTELHSLTNALFSAFA